MKSALLTTRTSQLSFAISLIFLIILIVLFYLHARILLKFQDIRRQKAINPAEAEERVKTLREENESVEVLYEDFHDTSLLRQGCLFVTTVRCVLVSIIFAIMYEYPLAQSVLLLIISVVYILYLALARPFCKSSDEFQNYFFETIIFIVNMMVLVMAEMDAQGVQETEIRSRIYCWIDPPAPSQDQIIEMNLLLTIKYHFKW